MTKNKWTSKLAVVFAAIFAASCAENMIRDLEKTPRDEREFNNALANEYEALAKKESRIYNDAIDARAFVVKGLQAASGMLVLPEDPKNWDIHKHDLPKLNALRDRLMFALDRGGRYIEPELGAEAQVAYDCVLEETEEGSRLHKHQKAEIKNCQKLAMKKIADLETAVFKFGPVRRVHFDYNSYHIEHDGIKTIAEVAERVRSHRDIANIMIIGHTDPTGKRQNNLVLSQNRATAVKKALMNYGVDSSMIAVSVGRGELNTSNKEFEPNNRVVDIYFHQVHNKGGKMK